MPQNPSQSQSNKAHDSHCVNPACPNPANPAKEVVVKGEDGKDELTYVYPTHCKSCGSLLMTRNRYRAFKKIGQGGFGSTYLVRDNDMPSRPWRVLKQLRPIENSPQIAQLSLELFNREAEVLEKLGEHSQIPKLYAHFEEDGKFYLVQEFVQGMTLSQEMHRNKMPMTEEQVRQIMQEMLLILSYVHSHNTVHRDIKPANLIRRKEDQRLVLIDFGAVKELDLDPNKKAVVEVTAIRSVGFSPPEQIAGQAVVPSSDLYALGATCLNLLTMESPANFFDSQLHCWNWSQRLELTPEFDAILTKILQPAISQRFASATDVLRALQGIGSGNGISQQQIILPPTLESSNGSGGLISTDWSKRRSEGFQPVQMPRSAQTATVPHGSGSAPNTGFSFGRQSTGFSRPTSMAPIPTLAGADLRNRSMSNQNLSGRDMRKADIRGTDLSGSNLQRSDLRGVVFNTPKPRWLQILNWMFGQARTIGQIMGAILALIGSAGLVFWIVQQYATFWLATIAALLCGGLAWMVLWSLTTKMSFRRYHEEQQKRYTNLRKADLRGAQLEEKLRTFARRQGSILD